MVIIHGFINYRGADKKENYPTIEAFFNEISSLEYLRLNRDNVNGETLISIQGSSNHYGSLENDLIIRIEALSKLVDKETYALLYIYDSENFLQQDNWQVYVLNHNKLSINKDTFISPYNLKISVNL